MRSHLAAALCAALASFISPARAQDVPAPESHDVLEPPAHQPAAEPQPTPPPGSAARTWTEGAPRPELGFQLRAGSAGTDRALFGASFVGSSGPFTFGLSGDAIANVGGQHHHGSDGEHDWSDWCEQRSDGRCLRRVDFALSGFGGLRHRTSPFLGGARLRLELVGELGWQVSHVEERIRSAGGTTWSDASRAYPFAGVRGGVGIAFLRSAQVGVGAFARQSLAGRVCVNTDGGCTHVGGMTTGVFLLGGAEWGVGR